MHDEREIQLCADIANLALELRKVERRAMGVPRTQAIREIVDRHELLVIELEDYVAARDRPNVCAPPAEFYGEPWHWLKHRMGYREPWNFDNSFWKRGKERSTQSDMFKYGWVWDSVARPDDGSADAATLKLIEALTMLRELTGAVINHRSRYMWEPFEEVNARLIKADEVLNRLSGFKP